MKLEEKILALRKKRGLSQEGLAKRLKVTRQAVYKWEANITYPEIDKLKRLASLFEISFNDFFDDNVDITKNEVRISDTKNEEKTEPKEKKADNVSENQENTDEEKANKNRKWRIKGYSNSARRKKADGLEKFCERSAWGGN